MTAMHEHHANAATLLTSLGELPAHATPAERAAAVNALADAEITDRATELLYRLGAPGYQHNAAA
jgi:hypothetical protein